MSKYTDRVPDNVQITWGVCAILFCIGVGGSYRDFSVVNCGFAAIGGALAMGALWLGYCVIRTIIAIWR